MQQSAKKLVQPTYFPGEGWRYRNWVAPTIRELLQIMPRGTKVADYYPLGSKTPDPVWPAGETSNSHRLQLSVHFVNSTNKQQQAKARADARARAAKWRRSNNGKAH
jgi:hypothetical protein